ncbi:sodium efflux ABC transporter permease NatB [Niallia circulans]|uniref:ABC transporter permease n=1 Tax=Niallia circulans TaxID=1397 RepID=UPI00077C74B0|nr:ABC transporter permease [Niallia circulans]MDR4316914.1 ABC transporter permease [Niallia circulans]MED3840091.1 ABC transporter permease [Niallia circulans]MED4241778.1 ABC transporter permease [Niallia circulans]MED4250271.1 ABC transporter permease [Niallia circulans]QKH63523.1 ABC transporter permease [Niallia circulans]
MLFKLFLKELKDSFRDRRTLLLSVFLPIIMMTGLTLFYEKLVSSDEGDTYQLAIPTNINEEMKANLAAYTNIELIDSDNPEKMVKDGDAQAAILIENGFSEKLSQGENTNIVLIGDSFSEKSSTLLSIVMNALNEYEKMVVTERLNEAGVKSSIVQPFSIKQQEISAEDPTINLVAMLIPLILSLALGVGASPAAADLFAGEKEKKTMEALLMTPVKRSTLVISKWLTITTIGVLTGLITLLVVVLEIAFFTENLKNAVPVHDNFALIILFALVMTIIYSMLIASLLMITSIIGKTIKEAQSYSTPILLLTIFPMMLLSTTGINELTTNHFIIPFVNVFSTLKELIFGEIIYQHLLLTLGSNLVFIVISFLIGRMLFLKDKWVIN